MRTAEPCDSIQSNIPLTSARTQFFSLFFLSLTVEEEAEDITQKCQSDKGRERSALRESSLQEASREKNYSNRFELSSRATRRGTLKANATNSEF